MMPRASKIVRFLSAPQVAVMLDYRQADERLEGSIILPKVYARSMVLCGEDVDLIVVICAADDLVPEGLDDVCETSLVVVENAENEFLTMILVVVAW